MAGIPEVDDVGRSRKDDNRWQDARDEVGQQASGRPAAAVLSRTRASCRRNSRGRAGQRAPWI